MTNQDRTLKLWEAAPEAALAAAGNEAAPEGDPLAEEAGLRRLGEERRPTLYATSSNLALAAWEKLSENRCNDHVIR